MSREKKAVRERFRVAVFARDGGRCKVCGAEAVDAHHITPREQMPNGGYVLENGISLCEAHHIEAEATLRDRRPTGLVPETLYFLIASTKIGAIKASESL